MSKDPARSVRIGTSGWSYKEWEKVFYPDSKTPKLSFYSSIFSTAEIDSTFYANPSKSLVFGWARNTPKDFTFAVKLPKKITHEKALSLGKGVEVDLDEFLLLLAPLKESKKLGPLLVQLPPSFDAKQTTTLTNFLEILPGEYEFAVEFRNKSWLKNSEGLKSLLSSYGVSCTIVDEPLLPIDLNVTSKEFAFVRWHGHAQNPWYNYRYSSGEIEPWVERIKEIEKKTAHVYGYFNNHFHGFAVENSLELLQKLGKATAKQVEEYNRVHDYIEGRQPSLDAKLDF